MVKYIIKSYCTFEVECKNDRDAIKTFNNGLWDNSDLVNEEGIEVAKINDSGEYIVISE